MKSLDKSTHEAIRELMESDNESRRRARFVLLARIAGGEDVPSEAEIGALMAGLGSEAELASVDQVVTGVVACHSIVAAFRQDEAVEETRLNPTMPIVCGSSIARTLCRLDAAEGDARIGDMIWQPSGGTQFEPSGPIGQIVQDGLEALANRRPVATCDECGHLFVSRSGSATYCSARCRNAPATRAARARKRSS